MSAIHLGEECVSVCVQIIYHPVHMYVCDVYAHVCPRRRVFSQCPEEAERSAGNNRHEDNNELTGMGKLHIHVF